MSKKIPGVFDPWRQLDNPLVEEETPARKVPAAALDDETLPLTCVQFNGIRAGVNVWVYCEKEEDASPMARKAIVKVLASVSSQPDACEILRSWGIYAGPMKSSRDLSWEADGETVSFVIIATDDRLVPRMIDNLALALRELAQQIPPVSDKLVALKIRPYLK